MELFNLGFINVTLIDVLDILCRQSPVVDEFIESEHACDDHDCMWLK